jgi:hypothetical protein
VLNGEDPFKKPLTPDHQKQFADFGNDLDIAVSGVCLCLITCDADICRLVIDAPYVSADSVLLMLLVFVVCDLLTEEHISQLYA